MSFTLNILSSGAQPGRETTFPMQGEAMTLGRGETNDVILPDPTREVSTSHAVIQYRNGDYMIVDTSTNGTFLNNDPEPLGDLPTPLNHGDVLRIGAYELQVSVAMAAQSGDPFADLPPPLGEEPILEDQGGNAMEEIGGIDTAGGDFLDDLLGAAPPNAMRMETRSGVNADDSTIDDFLDVEHDPNRDGGASAPNHSSPTRDFFSANTTDGGIPDDFDDELLAGIGGSAGGSGAGDAAAPPAGGGGGGGGGLIPETSFSDEPFEIPKPDATPAAPAADAPPPGPDPIDALLSARADQGIGIGDDQPPAPADLPDPLPDPAEVPEPQAGAADPAPAEPAAPDPAPEPAPEPAAPVTADPQPAPEPKPEPAPVTHAAAPATAQDLARRFLEAAGVDHGRIEDDELGQIMDRAGTAFRVLVEGARDVLMARKQVKDELRLGQTMISPDGNNPIKFSISGAQAVEAMIKPTVAGYQTADKAATEAMRDIKAHEVAMMSGMETAIKALLARFDPSTLGETIEASGALGGLLRNKKAKYWDAFEKLYTQISEDAEEDFNALFGKSFSRAYKDQLDQLKTQEED